MRLSAENQNHIRGIFQQHVCPAANKGKIPIGGLFLRLVKLMEQFIQLNYLFNSIRRARLLTVSKGSVCNIEAFRHIHRYDPLIENETRYLIIRIHITEKIGFFYIHKIIAKFKYTGVFV